MLTEAEMLDMRKMVLMGQELSLEDARKVFETLRTNQGGAVLAAEERKATKGSRKSNKPALSDEALDADLANLGL